MTDWLIDKSALVRLGSSPNSDDWASRIERGLVRITTVTRLFAAGELASPDSNRIRLRSFSFTYWQYETYHRIGWRASQGNGECAVALAISEVRGIVERN